MGFVSLFTSFEGRINREPFWIGTALISLVFVTALIAIAARFGIDVFDGPYAGSSALTLLLGGLMTIVAIPLMVKRLHGLNKSGHYLWLLCVPELLWATGDFLGITGTTDEANTLGWILAFIYFSIALWFLIELGFFRGTPGPNRFGADPLSKFSA